DHCILHSNQTRDEVYRQLRASKQAIATVTGECRYLAYPNGTADDVSPEARIAAESTQFSMAFSTIRGEVTLQSDLFFLPRIFAIPDFEEFCLLLNRSGCQRDVSAARWPVSEHAISGAN